MGIGTKIFPFLRKRKKLTAISAVRNLEVDRQAGTVEINRLPVLSGDRGFPVSAPSAPGPIADVAESGITLSARTVDALSATLPGLKTALKNRQYYEFVPSSLLHEVESGLAHTVQTVDGVTTLVKDASSGTFKGQLSLKKIKGTKSLGPLVAWQALHAIAGTVELQQINQKLDVAVRGIHELKQHGSARELGEIQSALAVMADIVAEEQTTGSVSDAMQSRLAGAEHVVGTQIGRILELVRGSNGEIHSLQSQGGPRAVKKLAGFLQEKAVETQQEMELLVNLVAADLKKEELFLRRSLEQSPEDSARRLDLIEKKLDRYKSILKQLPSMKTLVEQVETAAREFGWWRRNVLSRGVRKQVAGLRGLNVASPTNDLALMLGFEPIKIVIWEDDDGGRQVRALPISEDDRLLDRDSDADRT